MTKYPDVMKIQEERIRMENLLEEYPIIRKAEKVADLYRRITDLYTDKKERDDISLELKSLFI